MRRRGCWQGPHCVEDGCIHERCSHPRALALALAALPLTAPSSLPSLRGSSRLGSKVVLSKELDGAVIALGEVGGWCGKRAAACTGINTARADLVNAHQLAAHRFTTNCSLLTGRSPQTFPQVQIYPWKSL